MAAANHKLYDSEIVLMPRKGEGASVAGASAAFEALGDTASSA